jgi:hypothetical protein
MRKPARPATVVSADDAEYTTCWLERADESPRPGRARGRPLFGQGREPLDRRDGERIFRNEISRPEPLNLVGTRSPASPCSGLQLGTQWNAFLPVPAGRFMERISRNENVSENSVRALSSSSSLVLVLEIPRKTEDEGRRARTSTRPPHIFQTRSEISRPEPLNLVGTRSPASPCSGLQLGTQWNASLPVPTVRFTGNKQPIGAREKGRGR